MLNHSKTRCCILTLGIGLYWIFLRFAQAQPVDASFGLYSSVQLPDRFDRIRLLPEASTSLTSFLLWNQRQNRLFKMTFDTGRAVVDSLWYTTSISFNDAYVQGRDARGDLILLLKNDKRQELTSVAASPNGELRTISVVPLKNPAGSVTIADLNRDGILDVLYSDKSSQGLWILFSNGWGRFKEARSFGNDLSPGTHAVSRLNQDFLHDIVLYDWVKNELRIWYGLGNEQFFEQTIVPAIGDVQSIHAVPFGVSEIAILMLLLKDERRLDVWQVDVVGEVKRIAMHPFQDMPLMVRFSDINSDREPEVIGLYRPSRIEVMFNLFATEEARRQNIFAGADAIDMSLTDLNKDSLPDLVILDRESRLVHLLLNARTSAGLKDSLTFITGLRPTSVKFVGLFSDSTKDLVILNSGMGSIAGYAYRPRLSFEGGYHLISMVNPRTLFPVTETGTIPAFFVSSTRTRSFSVVEYESQRDSITVTTLPSSVDVELIGVRESGGQYDLLYTFNAPGRHRESSISIFRKLESTTFIERSFTAGGGGTIMGAAISFDPDQDRPELYFMARSTLSPTVDLVVASGASALDFRRRSLIYQFSDSMMTRAHIFALYDNNTSRKNLLINTISQDRSLYVMRQLSDTVFANPELIDDRFRLSSRNQMKFVDMDNDGILDIVAHDLERSSIGWFKGLGDMKFSSFHILIRSPFIGGFDLADLDEDGFPEIALTFSDKGIVRILHGSTFMSGHLRKSNVDSLKKNGQGW